MKLIKEHILFLIILSVCALLRFIPIFEYQFTLDEISGLSRTEFSSFRELIEKGVKIDAHPAFVQVLIYYLSQWFGYSAAVIKLPFLLCSMGALIYAYFLAYRNFSKHIALFTTLVFGFSLVFVFYAPIARMYISGVFFSVALLYYFFELFFLKQLTLKNYFLLGLFACLSAYNQHINALFALTVCLAGLFYLDKTNFKNYLITCGVVVLIYLPHLPITLYQLQTGAKEFGGSGWLEKPELVIVLKFLQILLGTGVCYITFLVLIILKQILEGPTKLNAKQKFLTLIFLFNFLVVYLYSLYKTPIYQHSVMLFSGVTMVFLVCSFLDFQKPYFFYPALVVLLLVLSYATFVTKNYYQNCVVTVFEYQFERTAYYKNLLGEKNVYPIYFDADDFMKEIYFEKYKTQFECLTSMDESTKSIEAFSDYVAGLKEDYLVLSSSMPIHAAIAKQYFPYLIENTQTQANNYKLYAKKDPGSSAIVDSEPVIFESKPESANGFKYNEGALNSFLKSGSKLIVDSTQEFPFDTRISYSQLFKKEGEVLLVKAKCKLKQPEKTEIEVCISVSEGSKMWIYNAKSASHYVINPDSTVNIYVDLFAGTKHDQIKTKPSEITCYLWNKNKENFVMQEFEIKVIDYWPQKWGFWK